MIKSVYDLDITDEEKPKIVNWFQNAPLRYVNNQSFNYSNLNETDRVINYLSDSLNKIVRNVLSNNSNNNTVTQTKPNPVKYFSDKYNKRLKVSNIYQYIGKESKSIPIQSDSYVSVSQYEILFKRADGTLGTRNLFNQKYNNQKKGYEYITSYGAVFIHEDFKYIELFKTSDPFGDNYTYILSN